MLVDPVVDVLDVPLDHRGELTVGTVEVVCHDAATNVFLPDNHLASIAKVGLACTGTGSAGPWLDGRTLEADSRVRMVDSDD